MDEKELLEIIKKAARDGATQLDLSKKGITVLPAEIGQLTNLEKLNLARNQLSDLPNEIGELVKLKVLNLTDTRIDVFPSAIFRLNTLQRLYLGHNNIKEIPEQIDALQDLELLYLHYNKIAQLPNAILNLKKLDSLTICFDSEENFIKCAYFIFQLTNLRRLNIGNFKLSAIPSEIINLKKLESLELTFLSLSNLTFMISAFTNLKTLRLEGNQLNNLPAEIGQLYNLQALTISSNQFKILPPEIGKLTGLSTFNFSNNPLTSPPAEVIDQGTEAVLSYLREKMQEPEPQWVSKMVLVGQGGVGKTQLLRRLRGESFDPALPTTHGIAIQALDLPHPTESGVTMQLKAWDFGGQEIYHATHQFFLTDRSLFVLVWNARHEFAQGKLYYWLDAIQARAPQSPILIVATQTDERNADLPLAEIKIKYPQVVGLWPVSNLTGAGIDELREAITASAAALPLMGEMWPKTWLDAANAIRERPEKHISPQEMQAIMRECKVSEAGIPVLARWLHELGDILYFRDDAELSDLVILKPQWASTYISRVVDDEQVIASQGIFTHAQMSTIWLDLPPSLREHFLRLMEEFDLSYRTLEQREVSLVVERLPLDPPAYQDEWNAALQKPASHEISIRYRLNTIPPGIPTWFIARAHRFTIHKHWRNGALFRHDQDGQSLALVQAFPHERYLQLSVRGANPHNFFALLKDGLELTLNRYPGLNKDRKIPCPGHNDQPCTHEFDYEQLIKRLEKKPYIECPEALEDVDVRTLLFGLTPVTLDDVRQKVDELLEKEEERHNELVSLLQREFMKNFRREQSQMDAYCPNVFTLRPQNSANWKKALMGEKVELQLYCHQPGCWHPTENGGKYIIPRPVEWLQKTGPYLKTLMTVFKYVSPFVGPWIGMVAADYKKLIDDDLNFMKELINVMPDLIDQHELDLVRKTQSVGDRDDLERINGAALRAVRQLLDEVDSAQNWGGLRKVLTPEGHYLWLCEHHAKEYLV